MTDQQATNIDKFIRHIYEHKQPLTFSEYFNDCFKKQDQAGELRTFKHLLEIKGLIKRDGVYTALTEKADRILLVGYKQYEAEIEQEIQNLKDDKQLTRDSIQLSKKVAIITVGVSLFTLMISLINVWIAYQNSNRDELRFLKEQQELQQIQLLKVQTPLIPTDSVGNYHHAKMLIDSSQH
jgi:hypothetical protein